MALVSILRRKTVETNFNDSLRSISVPNTSIIKKKTAEKCTQYHWTQSLENISALNSLFKTKEKLIGKSTISVSTQCCLLPVFKEPSPPLPLPIIKTLKTSETQCCLRDNHTAIILPVESKPKTENKSIQINYVGTPVYEGNSPLLNHVWQVFLEGESYYTQLRIEAVSDYLGREFIIISKLGSKGSLGAVLDPVTLTIRKDGDCTLLVLFRKAENHNLIDLEGQLDVEKFKSLMNYLLPSSQNIFCPGINLDLIKDGEMHATMIRHDFPTTRYQSKKCEVYYNATKATKLGIRQCINCKYATNCLTKARKRRLDETPTRKYKRQSINSNFSIVNLTPLSKKLRLTRLRKAKIILNKKLAKLEAKLKRKEVDLDGEQSDEMEVITDFINNNCADELNTVLNDPKLLRKRKELLKRAWEKDSKLKQKKDKEDFLKDQESCETGKKTNRWSAITLRIALAIYCRSPAAFKALRSFKILNLPCEGTLKTKSRKFSLKPGINQEYLAEEGEKYIAFQVEKLKKGESKPQGQGVTIFDEVKVIDKVIWNSKSNEFKGFAMPRESFNDLNDIFEPKHSKAPSATQYILQFIWRDLTSDYHLIGPYFTSSSSFHQHFVADALFKTLEVFNTYGFCTMGLVCDGASENLALIKGTLGLKGPIPTDKDNLKFNPSFQNPFIEGKLIHWIICPSHQLKSMVQALFSSKPNGPKQFSRGGIDFGWRDIQALKRREEARFERKETRFVPKLLTSYIIRDSWTRLNVTPSKIMQQEPVLSELYEFAVGNMGKEESRKSTQLTYDYLRACNRLFERGLLAKEKITIQDQSSIDSMKLGFAYFSDWVKEVMEDPDVKLTSPLQTEFLSWQTWDLLRICVFGMFNLCEDFLSQYPENFISPPRVNGSSIESFFSQVKYAAGSKTSGIYYEAGVKAVLCKGNIHGHNASNKDMRDTHLYIQNVTF